MKRTEQRFLTKTHPTGETGAVEAAVMNASLTSPQRDKAGPAPTGTAGVN